MSMSYIIPDTLTMTRRILVHMLRNPVITLLSTLGTPIVLLLMMYNLFGGVIQSSGIGESYIDYLTPGLILITAIYSMGLAAIRVNTDMNEGIIARFRTMSIARVSVLNGHVIGSTLGTLFSISVIIGLAVLTGFRPTTTAVEWVAALGFVVLFVVALTWLSVGIGVASKSPAATESSLFVLYILPFFSNAFLPSSSMSPVVAWIADNQPFSPIIDTMRGLLMGTPVGDRGLIAVAWCMAFILIGYLGSRAAYNRSANK